MTLLFFVLTVRVKDNFNFEHVKLKNLSVFSMKLYNLEVFEYDKLKYID